jgi:hypothetical protein
MDGRPLPSAKNPILQVCSFVHLCFSSLIPVTLLVFSYKPDCKRVQDVAGEEAAGGGGG